jgi:hypothetical protein
MPPDVDSQVAVWVDAILHGAEGDISFDAIYSAAFKSTYEGTSDSYLNALRDAFETVVLQFQEELAGHPSGAFNLALQQLCHFVVAAVRKLSAAFLPLTFSIRNVDLNRDLLDIFKTTIFGAASSLGHLDLFLVSYAHLLPGSNDVMDQFSMIEMLVIFLMGTPKWELFARHLQEATESLCVQISASAMEDPNVSANFIVYLSLVREILENEEKLWALLPRDLAQHLRDIVLNCMISSCKHEILFHPRSEITWHDFFFNNLGHLQFLDLFCKTVFIDPELRLDLVHFMAGYFLTKASYFVDTIAQTPEGACEAAEFMLDTFERLDLLMDCIALPHSRDVIDNVKQVIMQNPRFEVEKSLAIWLGKSIHTMCEAPASQRESRYLIRQSAKLIAFMVNRKKFIRWHSHGMVVRLCESVGRVLAVERIVLEEIQPYLAPSLILPIHERLFVFEESGAVRRKWREKASDSPLYVFLLPAVKAPYITTVFNSIRLPVPFCDFQNQFEIFYRTLRGSERVRFQWIYEDNVVTFRLVSPGRFDFLLQLPLLAGLVLIAVYQFPQSAVEKIAAVCGFTKNLTLGIVRRAAGPKFPLLLAVNNVVTFNPAFQTRRRKVRISFPGLSLQKPPKKEEKPDAAPVSAQYQALVAGIVKQKKTVDAQNLANRVQERLEKLGITFRKEEYERALIRLEGARFITRNPTRPTQYVYVV